MSNDTAAARVDGGRAFKLDSSGRWAGERLLKAMQEGRPMSPQELRTLETLPYEAWKAFDDVAIREAMIRAPTFRELINAGLTIPVPNAMGKTMLQWDKVTDMEAAIVSLDGLARSDNDRVTFDQGNIPLPITHKDFNIGLRTLEASRSGGQPLDTLQVEISGRKCGEQLENMLYNGGPTFGSASIYGLLNHPNRNSGAFGTNGNWAQAAKTGADIFADVNGAISVLRNTALMPGPYWMGVPGNYSTKLDEDYKANGDRTIRERLLLIEGLERIVVSDKIPANTVVIFQATRDVVAIADGEGIQTIQWDIYGGMAIAFKVFAIQVPVVRADAGNRSGVYVIS